MPVDSPLPSYRPQLCNPCSISDSLHLHATNVIPQQGDLLSSVFMLEDNVTQKNYIQFVSLPSKMIVAVPLSIARVAIRELTVAPNTLANRTSFLGEFELQHHIH